jgi:hypothetical protein
MKRTLIQLLAAGMLFSCTAWGQQPPPPDDPQEAPDKGVARISLINGDVSIRRGDDGDWVAAAVNAPLVVYDHVVTGDRSRAEVQFDWANLVRLSSNAEIRIAQLENQRYQVQLASGTATLAVLRDSKADMEVDTPNVSVRAVQRGDIRIAVLDDGDTQVTVRSGQAEVFTPKGVERVSAGQTMTVRGPVEDPEYRVDHAIASDDFDRWNADRDRQLERSASYRYVSPDVYGADDLDAYGRWIYVPPYGWVWSPNGVAADWAPYRYGRWAWLDWYGWTWVSYDPWGWAPYHYGRWFYGAPYGWCWYPGPIYQRHYWSPALVAFFGYGGGGVGVSVGFGFGNIGWVPLAPYERYHPWYGRGYYGWGGRPVNNITVVNNVNIINDYRNARLGNGITGIGASEFAQGHAGRLIRPGDPMLQRAALVQGALPVTPRAESLRVSDRQPRIHNELRMPQRFYSPRPAAPVQRMTFEQQRRGVEQVVDRSFGGRPQAPVVDRGAQRVETSPAASEGWRRVGEPAGGRAAAQPGATRIEASPAAERGRQAQPPAERGNAAQTWRTFGGQPQPGAQAPGRVERPQPNAGNQNWRSFGGNRGGGQPPARTERPQVQREGPPPGRAERQQSQPQRDYKQERRNFSSGSDGWRGFSSSPRTSGPQSGTARSSDGWGTFSAAPRSYEPRAVPQAGDTWRGYGAGRASGPTQMQMPRPEAPRYQPRTEPLRINPPIVRERSAPRFQSGGGGGRNAARESGGGGGSRGNGRRR